MPTRLRVTFTKPSADEPWPFNRTDLDGTEWKTEENQWESWFNSNRSETATSTMVSDTEMYVDIIFANRSEYDSYMVEQASNNVGSQYQSSSWQQIENNDGYTFSYDVSDI